MIHSHPQLSSAVITTVAIYNSHWQSSENSHPQSLSQSSSTVIHSHHSRSPQASSTVILYSHHSRPSSQSLSTVIIHSHHPQSWWLWIHNCHPRSSPQSSSTVIIWVISHDPQSSFTVHSIIHSHHSWSSDSHPQSSFTVIIHSHHTQSSYKVIIHSHHSRHHLQSSFTVIIHSHHSQSSFTFIVVITVIIRRHHSQSSYPVIIQSNQSQSPFTLSFTVRHSQSVRAHPNHHSQSIWEWLALAMNADCGWLTVNASVNGMINHSHSQSFRSHDSQPSFTITFASHRRHHSPCFISRSHHYYMYQLFTAIIHCRHCNIDCHRSPSSFTEIIHCHHSLS
jgi:hypothetical protein